MNPPIGHHPEADGQTAPTPTAAPPGANRPLTAAILHGYGRLDWPDLGAILAGVTTAWADYDGFHIGTAPTAAPPYTHLWAWTKDWLLRARIDGHTAIVGVLQLGEHGPNLPIDQSWPVRYTLDTAHTWPPGERRVGPLDSSVSGRKVNLYQVAGANPITFIRVKPE